MNKFAPVLIATLNRHVHFKRCVESLAACTHADETDLYVAFDYPLTESHWDGYRKITEYLPTIKRFKSVNIIRREKNFGARGNIGDARKTIFEKYDRMILSEDDNEFSPNFLDYINKGLEIFKNNKKINGICGYKYFINIPNKFIDNYFVNHIISGWGYAIWRDRDIKSIYTPDKLISIMKNKQKVKKILSVSEQLAANIISKIKHKKELYGDAAIYLYNILNDKYCVFPIISKVRNYGHDGSGVHCGNKGYNKYSTQTIDQSNYFEFSNNKLNHNNEIDLIINKFKSASLKSKFLFYIKYFMFRIKFYK